MNVSESQPSAEVIDFRLAANKEALDRIYQQQDELLAQVSHSLRQDFCMVRSDRIHALHEQEKENLFLLSTWTF